MTKASFAWTQAALAEDKLDTFVIPAKSWKTRYRCKICGVGVVSYNSQKQTWSIWGSTLERDQAGKIKSWELIQPDAHIFYGTRVVDVADGLGKWEGYPNVSTRLG